MNDGIDENYSFPLVHFILAWFSFHLWLLVDYKLVVDLPCMLP